MRRTDARQMAGLALHCYKRGWDKIISTHRDRSGGRDTPEAVEGIGARGEDARRPRASTRRAAQMMMFLPMEYVRLYSHFPVWNIARGEYLASVETLMHEQWNKLLFKGDEGEFGMAGAISNGVRPTHAAVTPHDLMFEACNLTLAAGSTLGPTEIDAHLGRTGSLQEKDWVSDVAHAEYCMAAVAKRLGAPGGSAQSRRFLPPVATGMLAFACSFFGARNDYTRRHYDSHTNPDLDRTAEQEDAMRLPFALCVHNMVMALDGAMRAMPGREGLARRGKRPLPSRRTRAHGRGLRRRAHSCAAQHLLLHVRTHGLERQHELHGERRHPDRACRLRATACARTTRSETIGGATRASKRCSSRRTKTSACSKGPSSGT